MATVLLIATSAASVAYAEAPVVGFNEQPSQTSETQVTVSVHINDTESDPVSIAIRYSLDDGATWANATHLSGASFPVAGNTITDITTYGDGPNNRSNVAFYWDFSQESGMQSTDSAKIEVTPSDGSDDGAYIVSSAFTITGPSAPIFAVESGEVAEITETSAVVYYSVSDVGSAELTDFELTYATDAYFLANASYSENEPIAYSGSFSLTGATAIEGLTCGTTYHFVQTFTNGHSASVTSDDATFTTSDCAEGPVGDGTEESPYQITTCDQFIAINEDLDAFYILENDLDCSADGNDIMVGAPDVAFTGAFDGNEYSITIAIDVDGSDFDEDYEFGLFREVEEATIENLTVLGSIAGTNASVFGMLAGRIVDSILSEITVVADVYGTTTEPTIFAFGGIAGSAYDNEINDVSVSGTVEAFGEEVGGAFGSMGCGATVDDSDSSADVFGVNNVGGFAGRDACEGPGSIVTNSYATGEVRATGESVGGFVGNAYYIDYDEVYATGDVYGVYEVGGLIGVYTGFDTPLDGMLFHSYATGDVYGAYEVGGLVGGSKEGIISQSYATGNVSTLDGIDSGDDFGGFIGFINETIIRDSYATGDVYGYEDVGGFSGYIDEGAARTTNSYSVGTPTKVDDEDPEDIVVAGGFTGGYDSEYSFHELFWDMEESGVAVACGNYLEEEADCDVTGKTTSEMQTESTFTEAGWNFDTVWALDEEINQGYPYLLGGDDDVVTPPQAPGPVETILDVNQFRGGGVAQGWNVDDDYWQYNLPFTFSFYGVDYTEIFISSNGYIGFTEDGEMGDYGFDVDDIIGAPIIMALQDDLVTNVSDGEGGYLTDIYITDEDNGSLVIRWVAADIDDTDVILNFEIVLHSDDTFEINYGGQESDMVDDIAAVGVQDGINSYVASEYNNRANFDTLDTSSWDWEEEVEEQFEEPEIAEDSIYEMLRQSFEDIEDSFWTGVSASSDGSRLVAVGSGFLEEENNNVAVIYISTDAGESWELSTSSPDTFYTSVVSSADGMSLMALGPRIEDGFNNFSFVVTKSVDGGETWDTQVMRELVTEELNEAYDNELAFFVILYISRITASSDLSKVYVALFDRVMYSDDGGETWETVLDLSEVEETLIFPLSISTSANGAKVSVVLSPLMGDPAQSAVLFSDDYAQNWTPVLIGGDVYPFSTTVSRDGTRVFVTDASSQGMLISLDDGETWSTSENPDGYAWIYVAPSAAGEAIVASVMEDVSDQYEDDGMWIKIHIYSSLDDGVTWTKQSESEPQDEGDSFGSFLGLLVGNLSGSYNLSTLGLVTFSELYVITREEPTLPEVVEEAPRRSRGGGRSRSAVRQETAAPETTCTGAQCGVVHSSPVATSYSRNLTMGITGSDVLALQKFLNASGFTLASTGIGSSGNETETFGALTREALARFQAAHGIVPAAGYFGPVTRAYIENLGMSAGLTTPAIDSTETSVPQPVRNLDLNMIGDDVRALQAVLIAQGYSIPAGATGVFGAQTKSALSQYQIKNNLTPSAGYFGAKTRSQMTSAGLSGLWW